MSDAHLIRLKRLKFHCWHRGFREMDLILGNFADRFLPDLSDAELDDFEILLAQPDHDAYNWIIGKDETPEAFDTAIMNRLKKLDFMIDPSAPDAHHIKS